MNYVLAKRLELLEEVTRLQTSLGVKGDVAFTCETARYQHLYFILPLLNFQNDQNNNGNLPLSICLALILSLLNHNIQI